MKNKINLFLIFFCTLRFVLAWDCATSLAQDLTEEEFFENQTETSDQAELLETLERLRSNPININSASEIDLLEIPFLLPADAIAIIKYRRSLRHSMQLADLDSIPNLSSEIIDILPNYIVFESPKKRIKFPFHLDSRTRIIRKEKAVSEADNGDYENSPLQTYQRFTISTDEKFETGFLIEKDSGERDINDFQAYYLRMNQLPMGSQVILGNYSVSIGKGLIFGGTYGAGFSVNPLRSNLNQSRRIKPYRSVSENQALKGLAWQFDTSGYSGIVFLSRAFRDASLTEAGDVSSFYDTGLHRTESEKMKENRVEEDITGLSFNYKLMQTFHLGFTYAKTEFNKDVVFSDSLRERYDFYGSENELAGIDFNLFWNKLNFSGEIARSHIGKYASMFNAVFSDRKITASISWRNYDKQFHSFYGRAFGSFADMPQNENGFFANISYRIQKNTGVSGYFDFSKTLWRTFFEPMPTQKKRSLIQIAHRFNRNWETLLQWRSTTTYDYQNVTDDFGHEALVQLPQVNNNFRFQFDFRLSERFLLRNRIEKKWTKIHHDALWHENKIEREQGWIFYQNVYLKPVDSLTLIARLCFFDAPTYDTRIYVFENDVPGMLTNRMFYGRGNRFYLLAKYHLSNRFQLAFKWSSDFDDTSDFNEETINSENSETNNDFSFVVDIRI